MARKLVTYTRAALWAVLAVVLAMLAGMSFSGARFFAQTVPRDLDRAVSKTCAIEAHQMKQLVGAMPPTMVLGGVSLLLMTCVAVYGAICDSSYAERYACTREPWKQAAALAVFVLIAVTLVLIEVGELLAFSYLHASTACTEWTWPALYTSGAYSYMAVAAGMVIAGAGVTALTATVHPIRTAVYRPLTRPVSPVELEADGVVATDTTSGGENTDSDDDVL